MNDNTREKFQLARMYKYDDYIEQFESSKEIEEKQEVNTPTKKHRPRR